MIYFFLKAKPDLISKFTKEGSKDLRKFIIRNKLRRALVKLRFVRRLNLIVLNNRKSKDIKKYVAIISELKKTVTEKVYYKKLIIETMTENYLKCKVKESFIVNEELRSGLTNEFNRQKKAFCGFLQKMTG